MQKMIRTSALGLMLAWSAVASAQTLKLEPVEAKATTSASDATSAKRDATKADATKADATKADKTKADKTKADAAKQQASSALREATRASDRDSVRDAAKDNITAADHGAKASTGQKNQLANAEGHQERRGAAAVGKSGGSKPGHN